MGKKSFCFIICAVLIPLCLSGQTRTGRSQAALDAIYRNFSVEGTCLFRETYPFDEHFKASYLASEDTAEKKQYSYLWPFSSVLSAVTVMADGDDKYLELLKDRVLPGLEEYFDNERQPAAYSSYIVSAAPSDRFYDDNIWLGIDFTDIYRITSDKRYLDKAELIWKFIESGTDDFLGGGIYWCEQKKESKNTCSNAPGAVLALKLYNLTGNREYLDRGRELYDWTASHLRDSEDGLYYDSISVEGRVDKRKFAYNSGQMLQAAVLLYGITGKKHYLREAQSLAEACASRFFEYRQTGEYVLKKGNVWFSAIMLRGFLELYGVDGNDRYVGYFKDSMDFFWNETRDGNGLFDVETKKKGDRIHLLSQGAVAEMFARLEKLK
ncbi:MAG: glycoside hydrolase family 76 protein [Candidatus Cryptobacteroides sp.]